MMGWIWLVKFAHLCSMVIMTIYMSLRASAAKFYVIHYICNFKYFFSAMLLVMDFIHLGTYSLCYP